MMYVIVQQTSSGYLRTISNDETQCNKQSLGSAFTVTDYKEALDVVRQECVKAPSSVFHIFELKDSHKLKVETEKV